MASTFSDFGKPLNNFVDAYFKSQKQYQESEAKAIPLIKEQIRNLYASGDYEGATRVYNEEFLPRFNASTRSNVIKPFSPTVTKTSDIPLEYKTVSNNQYTGKADKDGFRPIKMNGDSFEVTPDLVVTRSIPATTETDYSKLPALLGSGSVKPVQPRVFGSPSTGYYTLGTDKSGGQVAVNLVEGLGYPDQIFNAGNDVYRVDRYGSTPAQKIASAPKKPEPPKIFGSPSTGYYTLSTDDSGQPQAAPLVGAAPPDSSASADKAEAQLEKMDLLAYNKYNEDVEYLRDLREKRVAEGLAFVTPRVEAYAKTEIIDPMAIGGKRNPNAKEIAAKKQELENLLASRALPLPADPTPPRYQSDSWRSTYGQVGDESGSSGASGVPSGTKIIMNGKTSEADLAEAYGEDWDTVQRLNYNLFYDKNGQWKYKPYEYLPKGMKLDLPAEVSPKNVVGGEGLIQEIPAGRSNGFVPPPRKGIFNRAKKKASNYSQPKVKSKKRPTASPAIAPRVPNAPKVKSKKETPADLINRLKGK